MVSRPSSGQYSSIERSEDNVLFGRFWKASGATLISALQRHAGMADGTPVTEGALAWADWLMACPANQQAFHAAWTSSDEAATRILIGEVVPGEIASLDIFRMTQGLVRQWMFDRAVLPSTARPAVTKPFRIPPVKAPEPARVPRQARNDPEEEEQGARFLLVRGLYDRRYLLSVRREIVDDTPLYCICVGPLAMTLDRREAEQLHGQLAEALGVYA